MKKLIFSLLLLLSGIPLLSAGDIAFTYAKSTGATNVGYGEGAGEKLPMTYSVCMKIENSDYAGMEVKYIEVMSPVEFPFATYTGWTANSLPGKGEYVTKTSSCSMTTNPIDASGRFDTPAKIGEDGVIYVGFDLVLTDTLPTQRGNINKSLYPLYTYEPKDVPNTCLIQINKSEFFDYNVPPYSFGALGITAGLSGGGKADCVAVTSMGTKAEFNPGEDVNLTFNLTNMGLDNVKSFNYKYTCEGKTSEGTKTLEAPLAANNNAYMPVSVKLPALSKAGTFPFSFTITDVDGKPNTSSMKTYSSDVVVPVFWPKKRVMMEEATATWCAWCMRGTVAMSQLKRMMPDDFIGAAYHGNDPLSVGPFPMEFGTGYPGCALDRTLSYLDPFYGSGKELPENEFRIKSDIESCLGNFGAADMGLLTSFNEDKTQIKVRTCVMFGGMHDTDYKIGYILMQNNLSKDGMDDFEQNNASYSGKDEIPEMLKELAGMEPKLPGYNFNDVVIVSKDAAGVDGSLPATSEMEIGKLYNHYYTFPCTNIISGLKMDGKYKYPQDDPNYNLATDIDDMEVVAMLIDGQGRIVNARKVKVGESTEIPVNAINDIEADNASVIYYDLQGRRVNQPQRGIYIKKQGTKTSKIIL